MLVCVAILTRTHYLIFEPFHSVTHLACRPNVVIAFRRLMAQRALKALGLFLPLVAGKALCLGVPAFERDYVISRVRRPCLH